MLHGIIMPMLVCMHQWALLLCNLVISNLFLGNLLYQGDDALMENAL